MKPARYPRPLRPGDKIVFVSAAGIPDKKAVLKAADVLRQQGFDVRISQNALGKSGTYSGTPEQRYSDLEDALTDPDVRCVISTRGGYGAVHLLDRLDRLDLSQDPKWIVGFSDITALHALMAKKGIASVHGSMASHIALGADDPDNRQFLDILAGKKPNYTFKGTRFDRLGTADGILLGGNLAVLADLISTPFDIAKKDTILFVEDVSEPIYKIERIFYQLRLSGVLPNLRGLIVGQFTDYKPTENYKTMEEMIRDMVEPYKYPVAFNAPIGHVDHNIPVIEAVKVTLKVTASGENHLIYW